MKKNQKLIAAVCALLTTLSLTACELPFTSKSKSVVNVNNINFTDFSKDISADGIYSTIKKFSATDNARITGFEGEKNSAEYITKQFKDMGFNVTEQSFPIKAFRCAGTEVNIITNGNKKISSSFLTFSKATAKEGIAVDIVFGGMGTDSELENAKVKDKLVLMKRGGEFFRAKTERAFAKGAVGAIFYDPYEEQLISATLVEPSSIPAVSILKSEGENIVAMLASGKSVKITLKVDSECKDGTSKNIIATMKSKKQSNGKNIVVGAHYDGVDTPAANDNASGIATVMEAARVISKQKLDCDIKFIAFGAEEIGLVGSNYYVASLTSKDKSNIIAMLNIDMVGVGDTLTVHTMKADTKSLPADLAVTCMNKFKYKNARTEQESSDHVAFESSGIPVAYFEYGPDESYHTDKDTIDRIQKEDLLHTCNVLINMCNEIGKNPEGFSK
ncbi:MAG: M20/M25/M40 family metallo-hydrolase [Clostridium sp.]|uniref:M20/M25/M40 family metallo-hydrolase n=1 Tax=Clostridium sp. TaxID=1506 RepID=UPI003D6D0DE0